MIVGRFNAGEEARAIEFIHELAEGRELELWPGKVFRFKRGMGWQVWRDPSGAVVVSELTAEECDRAATADADGAHQREVEEERLRELSRAARELGPESIEVER